MRKPKIVIAGAGLGGLTAGLALLKRGFEVELYEQAENLEEIGAGVQIAANGTRVLYDLGLGSRLQRIGTTPTDKEVRLWNTGKSWKFIDLGATSVTKYGAPYFAMHRADLQSELIKAVRQEKGEAIHLNARCTGFDQSPAGVVVHFSDRSPIEADILVGADGIHSKIRQALFGPDKVQFSGFMAWRALVPTVHLPASISRNAGAFWIGPGAHVVHYPIRGSRQINFIGIVERSDWKVESWTETGTTDELSRDFAGWHVDVQAMIHDIELPYKWALIFREPIARWSVGRVTLLGDACHSTLPFLAQGANMAIEDGYMLARALDKYGADHASALAGYEAARIERTTRVVRVSAEQASRVHNPSLSDPAVAEAHVEREWEKNRVTDRYDWLYEYNALTAPL
jgi:salicylate hydroxylase